MAYLGMEHLWSRAGANSGNGRQMHGTHRPHDYLRLAANTCPRLPKVLHGKEGRRFESVRGLCKTPA
jgi:hypothetical protein